MEYKIMCVYIMFHLIWIRSMPVKLLGSIKVVTEFKLNLVWKTMSTLRNVKTMVLSVNQLDKVWCSTLTWSN